MIVVVEIWLCLIDYFFVVVGVDFVVVVVVVFLWCCDFVVLEGVVVVVGICFGVNVVVSVFIGSGSCYWGGRVGFLEFVVGGGGIWLMLWSLLVVGILWWRFLFDFYGDLVVENVFLWYYEFWYYFFCWVWRIV